MPIDSEFFRIHLLLAIQLYCLKLYLIDSSVNTL